MKDWLKILFNGLWVGGLAILLLTWSWASWLVGETRSGLRNVLDRPSIRTAIYAGLTFFCLGLAFTASRWWEHILWGILATIFLVQMVWVGRKIER